MFEALKSLFENSVISEEIQNELETAWNNKIQENREQVTQQLREEFAQKYEHDKSVLAEAVEQMITDRLAAEVSEFMEDRSQLAEAKAKYAVAVREHSARLNSFVAEALAKEVTDLHQDRSKLSEHFAALEGFVVESLAKEIASFYEDRRDLDETKVRLVKEAKEQFEQLKSNFVKQASKLVESVVTKGLTVEIKSLREDISRAQQNDFGRRIFEAFNAEYQHSLLNEKSETSKLLRVIAQKDAALAEARAQVSEKQSLVESATREAAQAKNEAVRKEILGELLSPLSREHRGIMSELLESVKTDRLRTSFDKYLPTVLNGASADIKRTLTESKEVTGNKQVNSISSANSQGEVIDIRRLAGLK